jgi:hypothetical protein
MDIRLQIAGSIALAASIAIPGAANAGFKCGFNKIASQGDTTAQVRMKCGSPISEEILTNSLGLEVGQRWVYRDPADKRWIKILEFRGGKLQSVTETKQ